MKEGVFHYGERKVIVTGGNSGIGAEIALELANCGCKTIIVGRDIEKAQGTVSKINELGGYSEYIIGDLSKADECKRVVEETVNMVGGIDVLVNCAGILTKSSLEDISEDEWDCVIKNNLNSCFFMSQKSLPYLRKGFHPRIINISSNAGRMGGYENSQAYTAAKGGMIAISMGMARQLASTGITVNVVCPGTTVTNMGMEYDEEVQKRLLSRIPIGRLGKAEDTAAAVCYFACEETDFVTGAILDVNGGMYMG